MEDLQNKQIHINVDNTLNYPKRFNWKSQAQKKDRKLSLIILMLGIAVFGINLLIIHGFWGTKANLLIAILMILGITLCGVAFSYSYRSIVGPTLRSPIQTTKSFYGLSGVCGGRL